MTSDREYTKRLENVIKQMLQPLRDIPFNLAIETITGKKVIPFDFNNKEHSESIGITKTSFIKRRKRNKQNRNFKTKTQ